MRYPEFLSEKGTIGFVAPSFGCSIEPYMTAFKNAQNKFKEMGYKLDLGPNCYELSGIGISNAPIKCGEEFTEYYLSENNDCLISCGGGELMCEILEYVDFEAIKQAKPKWFLGYSDNTNLTFLLATLCDTASVYGPCAAAFGMEPWHPCMKDALAVLQGRTQEIHSYGLWEKDSLKDEEHPLLPYNCTEKLELKCYLPQMLTENQVMMQVSNQASMTGRLIGGCMDCLVTLVGTKFDRVTEFLEQYKQDGFIWFLESCDLSVFDIRRAMWQMEQAGWFKYVKGFLFGRPLVHGQEMMGLNQYAAVLPVIQRHQVPVIMDADVGHLAPMMPLVTGSVVEMTAIDQTLKINMEYK